MSIIDILLHIAAAVLGYVIGSVNAAVIITKYILKSDVRERGSKNAGAANVTRVFGPVAGGCTLLLDMAKVMLVMWLGGVIARRNRHGHGGDSLPYGALLPHILRL